MPKFNHQMLAACCTNNCQFHVHRGRHFYIEGANPARQLVPQSAAIGAGHGCSDMDLSTPMQKDCIGGWSRRSQRKRMPRNPGSTDNRRQRSIKCQKKYWGQFSARQRKAAIGRVGSIAPSGPTGQGRWRARKMAEAAIREAPPAMRTKPELRRVQVGLEGWRRGPVAINRTHLTRHAVPAILPAWRRFSGGSVPR